MTKPSGSKTGLMVKKARSHSLVRSVAQILKDDESVYLVGGSLRDFALGAAPLDFDFISRKPFSAAKTVAKKLGRSVIKLGKGSDVIYRIPLKGGSIDFSPFRETTVQNNLGKRDFTINSFGIHLRTFTLLYPPPAGSDIDGLVLRECSGRSFSDDPLRMIRAYRMKALFPGLRWAETTREAIRREAAGIRGVAPERVQAELTKILEAPDSASVIRMMADDGVLFEVFRELAEIRGLPQSAPHKSDVFTHTLEMLDILDGDLGRFGGSSLFHASASDLLRLRLSILFHDTGKARCFSREGDAVHFYGHQKESASSAAACLRRLRFSNAVVNDVVGLCQMHMRPILLHHEGSPTMAAKRRLIRDAGENIRLLMLLSLLDVSSMDRSSRELEDYRSFCRDMFGMVEEEGKKILHPPKLINGLEAMKILGFEKPGPALGRALIALADAQAEGAVKTPKEASAFLEKYRKETIKN